MKTFREHLVEDGVAAIANSVGTTDKASVAGEPIKKAGIKSIRRNGKAFNEGTGVPPSELLKKIHRPENKYEKHPDYNTGNDPEPKKMKPYPKPEKKSTKETDDLKAKATAAGFVGGSFFRKIA